MYCTYMSVRAIPTYGVYRLCVCNILTTFYHIYYYSATGDVVKCSLYNSTLIGR